MSQRSIQVNPLNNPSSWTDIKQWRDSHESSPVNTAYGEFDANEISTLRLQEAYEYFESLPTLQENKLTWKLADNSFVALEKVQLLEVITELKAKRSLRAAYLHVKAEEFNSMEVKPTLSFLSDITNWGVI
jgi:hypothetical protein